ncbi:MULTISPECIES: TetR/AcrR family transcriptional regulator [Micromonospora]|uniref:TetR/AcrR family transcriptional regulator n=1 Tax=Micromonospora TaxID=1873 RepID=UPI001EE97739|nr:MULTISPECIES: TetR/AcrR family transcriptional regulator [Micromonospora]MCG5452013.1 TetR/AcrR family transcriptional regulator [Micromonospora hortensis]MCX5117643.1 TetR/AcrR family transcriptional regulator [Micromonospora sp. NBC_00362]WTI10281.1 TetR/AcrR family transcriptional regulator [Micromonospora sp. NBC_00821]
MTTEKRRAPAGAAVLRDEITTAIRRALMQELAAVGYGRLSIEAVARRAGVSKTAIYRRWSSKLDLVLEVVAAAAHGKLPALDTGTLRGDLALLFQAVAHALRHPLASQIIPDLLAEAARNPSIDATLRQVLHARQQEIGGHLVTRAVQRGELPADTELDAAVDLIVGPLYWRLAIARLPLTDGYLDRLVESVVAGMGANRALSAPRAAPI